MLADALKQMRKDSGLTLEQVAAKSGVPMSTISRISSGETKDPSITTVSALVQAMGGSLDDLYGTAKRKPESVPAVKACDGENCTLMKLYERQRVSDEHWRESMTEQHEQRVQGIKEVYENRIESIEKKYAKMLSDKDKVLHRLLIIIIAITILATVLVIADLFVTSNGWLRH